MPLPDAKTVFLRGSRLYLRPLSKDDVPALMRWENDPRVRKYLQSNLPLTEADVIASLESLRGQDKYLTFVVVDSAHDRPIGTMELRAIEWKDRRATSAAMIGEPGYWGKGFGTEAQMLVLDYAFNTLNLERISAYVLDFNKRSMKYSKKCGYKYEGRFKRHVFRNGKYWDIIAMAVFKKDWLPLWKKFQKSEEL